jgi:hypothetical protein
MSKIPTEEWFLFGDKALNYANEIVREIHWLDPRLEKYHHVLPIKHVSTTSPFPWGGKTQWGYGFWFHFEMDRGRPHCGHVYRVYPIPDMQGNIIELSRCGDIHYKRGRIDPRYITINCSVFDLTGEILLDAIRNYIVEEVLGS